MIEGVDYSTPRPDPRCLFAAGKRFASRYISPPGGIDKDLTAAEAQALIAAGVAVVCNWENAAGDALKGHTTGVAHATMAKDHAAAVGKPDGRPIYYSVDVQVTTAQMEQAVGPYFQGINEVFGGPARVGAYGSYLCIKWLFDHHLIAWGWQTYAWSNRAMVFGDTNEATKHDIVWEPRAQVQQYNNTEIVCGAEVDLDRALVDDYGQWPFEEADVTADELATALQPLKDDVAALKTALATHDGKFDSFRNNEFTRDKDEAVKDRQAQRRLRDAILAAAQAAVAALKAAAPPN